MTSGNNETFLVGKKRAIFWDLKNGVRIHKNKHRETKREKSKARDY